MQSEESTAAQRRLTGTILLVLLLGLGLRLEPIRHGLPDNYVRDSEFPHAALLMLQNQEPVPPLHEYTHWPYLPAYLAAALFGGLFVVGKLLGKWSGTDEFGAFLLDNPSAEQLMGRLLVATLGVLTLWVTYRVARALGLRRAWVAPWLVATSLLHLHLSVQERPWVPMILFSALALWGSVVHLKTGRALPLLLACAAAACAYSTRSLAEQGRVVLGIPGLAWYLSPLAWRGPALGRRVLLGLGGIASFVALALLVGRPYLLLHGSESAISVIAEQLGSAAGAFFLQADFLLTDRAIPVVFRAHSFVALGRAFSLYEPSLLALGLPGLLLAFRHRSYWPGSVFLVLWAALFLGHRNGHVADSAPLVLFLAFPAALAAERAFSRRGLMPVVIILLIAPLVISIKYVDVMRQTDTRQLAEARLGDLPGHLPIGVDEQGPQPLLDRSALERLTKLRGRVGGHLGRRDTRRLDALIKAPDSVPKGLNVLAMRDVLDLEYSLGPLAGLAGRTRRGDTHVTYLGGARASYGVWSGGQYEELSWPRDLPPVLPELHDLGRSAGAVLRELGVRYVLLMDFNPAGDAPHPLAELVQGKQLLWVIEAGPAGAALFESRLPLELEAPWLSLWQLERPGPRVRLFEF